VEISFYDWKKEENAIHCLFIYLFISFTQKQEGRTHRAEAPITGSPCE
jgi:hypothetical protein